MKDIIEKGINEHEIRKFRIESMIPGTKEHFVKGVLDNIRNAGFEGDELFEKASKELTGGKWVTINGSHVYVKGGKIVAGAAYGKGGEKITTHTNENDERSSFETNKNKLAEAPVGAKASGGGYSAWKKISSNTWKNIKTERLSNSDGLASRIASFDDFKIH